MLRQRIITAIVLIIPVIYGIIYGETRWVALVTGVIIILGALEWTRLANTDKSSFRFVYTLVILVCLGAAYRTSDGPYAIYIVHAGVVWWLVAAGVLISTEVSGKLPVTSPASKLLTGIFTLIPAWLSLVLLHGSTSNDGRILLIFLFILIWTADISGYVIGRKWGKHALAPVVSPGKTWEGVAGAMLGCSLLSIVFSINKQFQLTESIIFLLICLLTASVSIIGDLTESLMKRTANIKDSGTILPGHGGILDRIDSFTAAGPFFLSCLYLLGVAR